MYIKKRLRMEGSGHSLELPTILVLRQPHWHTALAPAGTAGGFPQWGGEGWGRVGGRGVSRSEGKYDSLLSPYGGDVLWRGVFREWLKRGADPRKAGLQVGG